MFTDTINVVLGFLEGFALIISPCILPILPILLAGSLTGTRTRPFGILTGFVVVFALVAFFSRQIITLSGIDLNEVRHFSYGVLLCLGVIMVFSRLMDKFNRLGQRLISMMPLMAHANPQQKSFLSGFLFGGLVAIIWTPCAGPILAAVIVQVATQQSTLGGLITLVAFALGVGIPMMLFIIYGQQLIHAFHFFKKRAAALRSICGVFLIASVFFAVHQEWGGAFYKPTKKLTTIKTATDLQNGLWRPYPAPQITGIETWLNTPPLQSPCLKGHVVLVDFWTFSCINCLRTLPHIIDLYKKYHDKGLIIIGVHSPEFAFEKDVENVKRAVNLYGIEYPVALDNQFVTWRNFKNHYWPAHYLIDKQGNVVYEYFGEGGEDILENNVRYLLGIDGLVKTTQRVHSGFSLRQTPETYLGYARSSKLFSPAVVSHDKPAVYHISGYLPMDAWRLNGLWQINADKITARAATASLSLHFHAKHVYVVMGNTTAHPIAVKVLFNGQPLMNTDAGRDVQQGELLVVKHGLYELIALPKAADGELQLIAQQPGLEMYAFTFGS